MKKPIAAALLGAASAVVSAQETTLPPVIVTATRTAQTVDETLASVTVITRQDIERRQAQSVVEALRGTPGLTVTNQGGPGKASAVFLRGTESDHVLVLIDGVKVGGTTAAGIPWHDLPVDQIERIEVVRGPRSSLYGSEAIGGVIQIFTRKGGGKLRPSASLSAGSDDTYKGTFHLAGGGERSWFSIGASHLETDGFDACAPHPRSDCGPAGEPDEDGYRNSSVQARVGTRFGTTGEIDLSALRAWGHTKFDGYYNSNDFVEQVLGARLALSPLRGWQSSLAVGNERDQRDYFQNGVFMSRIDTSRDTASWQNDLSLGQGQLLTLGADYQHDEVDASSAYTVDSRDNIGVFLQYQASFGAHSLQLSGRHDDNEQFGGHVTGNVSWGYELARGLRLLAAAGTAFKAPTFDDLYNPWGGNPELDPERARNVELGLQTHGRAVDWSLALFQTDVDNLIVYQAEFDRMENIDKARIRGLELGANTRFHDWTVGASLTLLDPENRSAGANQGDALPRRARRSMRIDTDRDFGAFSVGASLFAESRRYSDTANTLELGGYGLLDLRAGFTPARDWRLQFEVKNVLDKDYQTIAYYNQAGRSYFLTLHYQPR